MGGTATSEPAKAGANAGSSLRMLKLGQKTAQTLDKRPGFCYSLIT